MEAGLSLFATKESRTFHSENCALSSDKKDSRSFWRFCTSSTGTGPSKSRVVLYAIDLRQSGLHPSSDR